MFESLLLPLAALVFAGGIIALIGVSLSAFDVVVNGKACATVVVPDEPGKVELYAAEEFRHHIRKASGAELALMRESEVESGGSGHVYIGRCRATHAVGIDPGAMPTNGYALRLVDDNLFIVGDDHDHDPFAERWLIENEQRRPVAGPDEKAGNAVIGDRSGTLFGVYSFLDRHLEVRWLWPGELGELVPHRSSIRVEACDHTGAPAFRWTDWRTTRDVDNWPDPKAGQAFYRAQQQWKKRIGFAETEDILPGHNFSNYWKRFGQSNPEFFNLLPSGERKPLPDDDRGVYVTMCVAEPALWHQIVDDWCVNGRTSMIKVGENDSPGMCTCEKCRSWDSPDWRFYTSPYWANGEIPRRGDRASGANVGLAGRSMAWVGWFPPDDAPSLSDRYAHFYKRIYEEASKVDPGVVVGGFAYANYWRAPKHTKLHEHILISYVPPLWYPYTERMSREMRVEWEGWRQTGAAMIFRPNLTHAGHVFPIYYAEPLIDDLKYVIASGPVGMDFDSLLGSWATQGPTMYALGRTIHRPDLGAEEILGEYYSAFGPAASAVRHYFHHWRDVSNGLDEDRINLFRFEENGGGFRTWVLIADRIFTPEVMAEGRRRLDQACKAADADSLATARIAYLEKGLTHVELTLKALSAYKAYREDPQCRGTFRQAVTQLYQYRRQVEHDMIANLGYLLRREPAEWWAVPEKEVMKQ